MEKKKQEIVDEVIVEVAKKEDNAPRGVSRERAFDIESWKPVTKLGKLIKIEKKIKQPVIFS